MLNRFNPGLSIGTMVIIGIALLIPVPYVLLTPGPVFNTIGSVSGKDLIRISGAKTYPTGGQLDMLTVSEFGGPQEGLSIFQAIKGLLDNTEKVLPREAVYDEGTTSQVASQQNAEAFNSSQSYATAAALSYLKLPIHDSVYISSVGEGVPAQGKLHAGDTIIAIDGKSVTDPEHVINSVRSKPIGSTLVFTLERAGNKSDVSVVSAPHPDDPTTTKNESKVAYVGIGVDVSYHGDFPIEFGVDGVGGPSAGTMFAVGIIDKLTPGMLNGGKHIAGTGTIDPDGVVGPIGGIQQKMIAAKNAGATLFLAPIGNCDEVIGHVPAGLTVTPMTTLSDAVKRIEDFTAGKHVPACSTN